MIEFNSGSIVSNVTKKLDYLITGDKPTKRKIDIAREMNIKILSQKDLLKMLNKLISMKLKKIFILHMIDS